MRKSSTNIGLLGIIESIIRKHPLVYLIFRSLIKFTNIFEKDFDGLKLLNFKHKINIIDVGASDGISVKYFFKNLSVNKIICYEPYQDYVNSLKKFDNIIIKPYAIGDKNCVKKIFYPTYSFFKKKYNLITYAHYDMNLMKHFIKDFYFRKNLIISSSYLKIKRIYKINYKVDLIKIDTNGYELNVIKGLLKIIKKDKPALIVEINKDHNKISNILKQYGYKSYYYSINEKKFSKKFNKNCTNKYFLQNTNLN